MKGYWHQTTARYDALAGRDRVLVGVAALVALAAAGYVLLLEPALARWQDAERGLTAQQAELAGLQSKSRTMQSEQRNPDLAAGAEVASLKTQQAALADRLQRTESSLVPPKRMAALLEAMIGQKSGLRLLSLKTIAQTPLSLKKPVLEDLSPADKQATTGLFKHGIEIKLEGSYQDLTAYLERLEQAKLKVLWSSVSLSAEKHPKLVLTLTVYTLSLDKTWLIV
jgi:MSHA biogenesis protein MshJ